MTERYQPVIRIQGGLSEADRKEFYRLRLYREAFAMGVAAADAMARIEPPKLVIDHLTM